MSTAHFAPEVFVLQIWGFRKGAWSDFKEISDQAEAAYIVGRALEAFPHDRFRYVPRVPGGQFSDTFPWTLEPVQPGRPMAVGFSGCVRLLLGAVAPSPPGSEGVGRRVSDGASLARPDRPNRPSKRSAAGGRRSRP